MSDTAIDHAERITTLEVQMAALTKSVEKQTEKIDELLGIVQQARGARFALVGVGVVSSGVLTLAMDYAHKLSAVFQAIVK